MTVEVASERHSRGVVEDRRSGGVDVIVDRVTVKVTDTKSLLR
jgi:hypothetical protein